MKNKLTLKILLITSLAIGVGLMIGGAFVTPLLPIGGAIVAAVIGSGLGLWQGVYADQEVPHGTHEEEIIRVATPELRTRANSDPVLGVQNNMFFIYGGQQNVGECNHASPPKLQLV